MVFGAFERQVAWRYLRARRQEGFVSVIASFSLLGIALGVGTLIVVMAVMNGFRADLVRTVVGLNGHLSVYGRVGPLPDYDALTAQLRQQPAVLDAMPVIEAQALAIAGSQALGVAARGVLPADFLRRPAIAGALRQDPAIPFEGRSVIAIGARLAERFDLDLGDTLTLVAPKGNVTALGTIPRLKDYTIAAIFDVGMYEYDLSFVYLPLEAAQIFFQIRTGVTNIDLFIADPEAVEAVQAEIEPLVWPQAIVWNWQNANASFLQLLDVQRNVVFIIVTLIVLVAALNIVAGLVILVKDKARGIAILRTMGATRGAVLRIFLLAGAAIGLVGTGVGLGLGVAFAANIDGIRRWLEDLIGVQLFNPEVYYLTRLPSRIDPADVGSVVLMALVLAFAATVYPAWRAARLEPVEALRYE